MSVFEAPAAVIEEAEREAKSRGSKLAYCVNADALTPIVNAKQKMESEIKERFGDEAHYDPETDTYTMDLTNPKEASAVRDIEQPWLRVKTERSSQTQAAVSDKQVEVRCAGTGNVVRVSPENEREVCEVLGSSPVIRWRKTIRLEKFSDGLLYRETMGEWECLNRCAMTRPHFECANPSCEWCA